MMYIYNPGLQEAEAEGTGVNEVSLKKEKKKSNHQRTTQDPVCLFLVVIRNSDKTVTLVLG